jgi:hypothetical protein
VFCLCLHYSAYVFLLLVDSSGYLHPDFYLRFHVWPCIFTIKLRARMKFEMKNKEAKCALTEIRGINPIVFRTALYVFRFLLI